MPGAAGYLGSGDSCVELEGDAAVAEVVGPCGEQAAVEGGEIWRDGLDGVEQAADLGGTGHDSPVDLLRCFRGLPGHFLDGVGREDVPFYGVAERALEHRALAGNSGRGSRAAIHGQREGVEGPADQLRPSLRLIQGCDVQRMLSEPGQCLTPQPLTRIWRL